MIDLGVNMYCNYASSCGSRRTGACSCRGGRYGDLDKVEDDEGDEGDADEEEEGEEEEGGGGGGGGGRGEEGEDTQEEGGEEGGGGGGRREKMQKKKRMGKKRFDLELPLLWCFAKNSSLLVSWWMGRRRWR